jgi:hypothetical protein
MPTDTFLKTANETKAAHRLYAFSPLVSADSTTRKRYAINERDLAKVSQRRAEMVDQLSGRPFRVRKIKRRGVADHVVLEGETSDA